MLDNHPILPKLAFSIEQLVEATSIGRTAIFEAIRKGRLRARHIGGRTIVTVEDARAWLLMASRSHTSEHQPKRKATAVESVAA